MYDEHMCISFCMHHNISPPIIISSLFMQCYVMMLCMVSFQVPSQQYFLGQLHSPVTFCIVQLYFTVQLHYTVTVHSPVTHSVEQRKFIIYTLTKITLWWGMTIEKIIVKMMSKKVGGLGWQFSFHTHKHTLSSSFLSLSSFPMLQSSFIRDN